MKYFNLVAAIAMACVYWMGNIPPREAYNLWMVYYAIPFVLLINIVLLIVTLVLKMKSGLFYVLALAVGSKYLVSTIGLKGFFKAGETPAGTAISVLNYNVSAFNEKVKTREMKPVLQSQDTASLKLKQWVLNNDQDIQCYQEFRYYPHAKNIDMLKHFAARGYESYFSCGEKNPDGSGFGVLIVSRFPIIAHGDIRQSSNGYNRIAYADIKIDTDTLRIINVHLQSMSMKRYNPVNASGIEDGKRDIKMIFWRLRFGVFERSKQVKELIEFIKSSPHPVVCVGDFNEIPYSYAYQRIKAHLKNSFEESGRGFGFTYNGNTLGMLRIDNQFYSSGLDILDFETLNKIRFTDHFPLVGRYYFSP